MQVHAVRFGPGQELFGSLQAFVEERRLRAPFIITCVGSVTKATLRLANATASNTNEVLFFHIHFGQFLTDFYILKKNNYLLNFLPA